MYRVTVIKTDGTEDQLNGIVGIAAGAGAVEFQDYTADSTIYTYNKIDKILKHPYTQDEALNCEECPGFAAWYKENLERHEAAEAEKAKAEGRGDVVGINSKKDSE